MVELLIVLIVIGALLYLGQMLPIHQTIKTIITVIVIVAVCIYLLRHLSVIGLG